MARPRKEIDQKDFESLRAIQCTQEEIQAFLEVKTGSKLSIDTIERWCKRTYKKSFAEISAQKRAIGKISLRRSGWKLAQKNPSVHIFYCKNFLGMTDKTENVTFTAEDIKQDSLSKSLEDLAEELTSDD